MMPGWLPDVPGYDVRAFRIPLLDITSESLRKSSQPMLEALRYSDRLQVRISGATHRESYQFPRVALAARARETETREDAGRIRERIASTHVQYEIVAELLRRFLDWKLTGDAAAAESFREMQATNRGRELSITRLPPLPAPPTEGELLTMVREGRVEEVVALVRRARVREPDLVLFREEPMTTMARFLQRDQGPETAVHIFRLIAETHPDSATAKENLKKALARLSP